MHEKSRDMAEGIGASAVLGCSHFSSFPLLREAIKRTEHSYFEERRIGDLFIRTNVLTRVGETIPGHTHVFDHITLFGRGVWRVRNVAPDGTEIVGNYASIRLSEAKLPTDLLILKDHKHDMTLIEAEDGAGVFHCIYTRGKQ